MSDSFSQGCLDLINYVKAQAQAYIDRGPQGNKKWFQKNVARDLGVDETFLTHLMRGRKRPSIDTAFAFERISVSEPSSRMKTAIKKVISIMKREKLSTVIIKENGDTRILNELAIPAENWTIKANTREVKSALASAKRTMEKTREVEIDDS